MSIFNDSTRSLLPKIKVTAFSDVQMTKEVGSLVLPYDEKNMEATFGNNIVDNNTLGKPSGSNEYQGAKTNDFKVTFILDDSTYSNPADFLASSISAPDSVDKVVKKMIRLLHTPSDPAVNSGPNFISLKSMNMPLTDSPGGGFKGRLVDMKIDNKLVTASGHRVKAEVSCTFKESLPPEKLKAMTSATVS